MKLFLKILTISTIWSNILFAQEAFVAGFEDLPLMQGLQAVEEELYFDTPDGRIVESSTYSDALKQSEVLHFYKTTLPQLGWKCLSENSFVREGENLIIETNIKNNRLEVKFFSQPRN